MTKISLLAVSLFLGSIYSPAQQYKVIYNFGSYEGDAAGPSVGLLRDGAGNLYGTASGGAYQGGAVFELLPNGGGGWTEAVLYSFCADYSNFACLDGSDPESALIMDSAGNLYGSTNTGGAGGSLDGGGDGVIFELSPPSHKGGAWTEAVLYNFCSDYVKSVCLDGAYPEGDVVLDASGSIYGTTTSGGSKSDGVAFELSPGATGWTETVIHSFCSNFQNGLCLDGSIPGGGLTPDNAGNLYGTTFGGGNPQPDGSGVIFKLTPGTLGWTLATLHEFALPQATSPLTTVVLDKAGNLYGTLSRNGAHNKGGLFQWLHSTGQLREIDFKGTDGAGPDGNVLIDVFGRGFFGAATSGGKNIGHGPAGTIYRVSLQGRKTTIYEFCSQPNCVDGMSPYGNLVEDPQGAIYGTTFTGGANVGGAYGSGVVYEITP